MGAEFSQAMARQFAQMIDVGLGVPVCLFSALVLAAIALKRFLFASVH
jgi:hypothetical protein